MTWGRAKFAAFFRRMGFQSRDGLKTESGKGQHGLAMFTSARSNPFGANAITPEFQVKLERRALSVSNRNREAAARYLEKHKSLIRGHCSDA